MKSSMTRLSHLEIANVLLAAEHRRLCAQVAVRDA
jgi:hypothetical protein